MNCLLLWIAIAGPDLVVRVVTIDSLTAGTKRPLESGPLLALDRDSVKLGASAGSLPRAIPLAQVLRLESAPPAPSSLTPTTGMPKSDCRVLLTDGSRLLCRDFRSEDRQARITLATGRKLEFPLDSVCGVLFGAQDSAESARWIAKATTPRSHDLLIAQRDGQIMELDGVIGPMSDALKFTLDGETISVKRERVRAIHYAHPFRPADAGLSLTDGAGNIWSVQDVRFDKKWEMTGPAASALTFAPNDVASIDFSRGRLTYLSDLEPSRETFVPFFDLPWQHRKDANMDGRPIRLNGETYPRGLTMHSKSTLEYSIDGRYRRFEALVGIEEGAGNRGDALARVLVDGRRAIEFRVKSREQPRLVEIDLSGARALTLEVDFGDGLDLGDHVAWAMARLLK